MIMWCVVVEYITPLHEAVGHLEIFWSRAPIFFIGINIAETVKRKDIVGGSAIWMIVITFVIALSSCLFLEQEKHGQFPLFLERMLYIPPYVYIDYPLQSSPSSYTKVYEQNTKSLWCIEFGALFDTFPLLYSIILSGLIGLIGLSLL